MPERKPLVYVLQHTSGEFLGLMEDHLEGRGIRFSYFRPFSGGSDVPSGMEFADALILLGGGPWGTKGNHIVPSLYQELELTSAFLARGRPVIGIGLGAQILSMAAGGDSIESDFIFEVGEARRVKEDALNGFLPERFPLVTFMRDWPVPPDYARTLAIDGRARPVLFQIGANCFGFTGHPGAKLAMAEDLIMEFEDLPANAPNALESLRLRQRDIEDALVRTMTGLIQLTGLMDPAKKARRQG